MKKRLSRQWYVFIGFTAGCWFWGAGFGFMQDLMGPEKWYEFEQAHWKPASESMPFQCLMMATTLAAWIFFQQKARADDALDSPKLPNSGKT